MTGADTSHARTGLSLAARCRSVAGRLVRPLLGATVVISLLHVQPTGVAFVVTPSIAEGVYLTIDAWAAGAPTPGDIVCFPYGQRGPAALQAKRYLSPQTVLCKPVVAREGALVRQAKNGHLELSADGKRWESVARLATRDAQGRPVEPFFGPTPSIVPPGHVLVLAPLHRNSLDSRYYGPVAVSDIRAKAFPLLTW